MNAAKFLGWAVLSMGAVGLCGGCGSEFNLGQVSGTVTLDGAPAGGLQILFEPQDMAKPSSMGFTQADGKYQLRCSSGDDGAVLGQHTVRVTPVERDEPAGPPIAIPAKYNSRSELVREVKAGSNTINLELAAQ